MQGKSPHPKTEVNEMQRKQQKTRIILNSKMMSRMPCLKTFRQKKIIFVDKETIVKILSLIQDFEFGPAESES